MNYEDIEELPERPEYTLWPIFPAFGFGLLVSFGSVLFNSAWFYLAYLPFLVVVPWTVARIWLRHRRFMRDLDGWHNRMTAYYDAEMRRIKARWS